MAHNAYIRGGIGSGLWTGVTLTPTDFETFDLRQYQSINGDLGGTWAPSSVITIGGSGVAISSNLELTSTCTLTVDPTAFLICEGTSTWTGTSSITFQSGSFITFQAGCTWACNATTATFGGGIAVANTSAFSAQVVFSNGIDVSGSTSTFSAPLQLTSTTLSTGTFTFGASGNVVNQGVIASTGAGHYRGRAPVAGADADATYGINDGDVVYRGTAITANRTWTITSTGAANGDRMSFMWTQPSGSFQIVVKNDSGTTLGVFAINTTVVGDYWQCIEFLFVGGAWVALPTNLIL